MFTGWVVVEFGKGACDGADGEIWVFDGFDRVHVGTAAEAEAAGGPGDIPGDIGQIASAFAELDDYPTKEQQSTLLRGLQGELGLSFQDAEENMILGRWFVSECGGPSPAIARLSRKLYKLDGANAIPPLMSIIQQLAQATSTDMSERQTSALADIKRAFHIK